MDQIKYFLLIQNDDKFKIDHTGTKHTLSIEGPDVEDEGIVEFVIEGDSCQARFDVRGKFGYTFLAAGGSSYIRVFWRPAGLDFFILDSIFRNR